MIIKEQVITHFNRGSATYQQAAGLQAQVAQKLADRLPTVSAAHVLEMGCGTGLLSQHLLSAFPDAQFLFTDIAPAMLKQCQQRYGNLVNTQFVCLDGESFSSAVAFDLIISSMTFHWFLQVANSIKNIIAHLKPGGRLLFAMLGNDSLQEWQTICRAANLPLATPIFPARNQLTIELPNVKFESQIITEIYPNLYAFLRTLKLLGATAPRAGYVPLTADKLRALFRKFNTEIAMTYEVIYGEYCHV